MPVGNCRPAHPANLRVDAPHQQVNVVAEHAILLHVLARRRRDLQEHRLSGIQLAGGKQLSNRADPLAQTLRVIQPVHAEQDVLRVPELLQQCLRLRLHLGALGEVMEALHINRNRVRPRRTNMAILHENAVTFHAVVRALAHQTQEVLRSRRGLEPNQIGP